MAEALAYARLPRAPPPMSRPLPAPSAPLPAVPFPGSPRRRDYDPRQTREHREFGREREINGTARERAVDRFAVDKGKGRERVEIKPKEVRREEREVQEVKKEEPEAKLPEKKEKKHVSPPVSIVDRGSGRTYDRIGFLGEGGFARVYEVMTGKADHKAIKVVNKSSIRTKRNKTKLWAEIKLHQMLQHTHVVHFDDCFEDDDNVYMVLELCENGSMMDLLRRRKRYTEPEARYFLVQLIGACQYMHEMSVIHRDLKLGNLFLDRGMNVKVGDFGLAALIENEGDRKKTICGTPNYIAPEVLFDTANGHSFEVDVWSVGVILYTLIIGKPPFQTKDVKAIYRRIRENRYEFPPDKEISSSAQDLIMSILNTDPDQRPTLTEILQHPWFTDGAFPAYIPATALDSAPDFSHITVSQSKRNFESARRRALSAPQSTVPTTSGDIGSSVMAQERAFNSAVQPGSPISALLASARQPMVQAPTAIKEPSLLRKLTAAGAQATLSPVRRGTAPRVPSSVVPTPGPSSRAPNMGNVVEEEEEEEPERHHGGGYAEGIRDREVAAQKARIVSQMAGMRISEDDERRERRSSPGKSRARSETEKVERVERPAVGPFVAARTGDLVDRVEHNLNQGLNLGKAGDFYIPGLADRPPAPKIFVISWLDYCAKYGMGFAMSDGAVSVHFNDSSSVVLAPGKQHIDHIDARQDRRNYSIERPPVELGNKVFLLRKFESYMLDRLCGSYDFKYDDTDLTTGMVYIEKYLRTKHVILFRLSNGILQFNFYDHTKLIISSDGLVCSIIDKYYEMYTYSLPGVTRLATQSADEKERHRLERFLNRLNHARDLLTKLRAHGGLTPSRADKERKEKPKTIR